MKKFAILFVFLLPILTFSDERQPAGVELINFYVMTGPAFDLGSTDQYDYEDDYDYGADVKQNLSWGALPTVGFGINIFTPQGYRMRYDVGITNAYFSYDVESDYDDKITNKYSFSYLFVGYRIINYYVYLGANLMIPVSGSRSIDGADFEPIEDGAFGGLLYSAYLGSDIELWANDKSGLNLKLQLEFIVSDHSGFPQSYGAFNLPLRAMAGVSYNMWFRGKK